MKRMAVLLVILAAGMVGVVTSTTAAQSTAAPAKAATRVVTLKVSGMTCAGCGAAVKLAARKIDGVKDVTVVYSKTTAAVTYDPAKTTPGAIAKFISEKSGFKAEVITPAKG